MLYVAVAFLALGLAMMARGWIYTIWPTGKIAEKRKRKNLKYGFTTDMKIFGRKVRRLGLLLALAGGGVLGWQMSHEADTVHSAGGSPTTSTTAPETASRPSP